MRSPVRGLRPSEARRFATLKVPNPTSRTSPPPLKEPVMESKTASTALPASALLMLALLATEATRSFLFTMKPPFWIGNGFLHRRELSMYDGVSVNGIPTSRASTQIPQKSLPFSEKRYRPRSANSWTKLSRFVPTTIPSLDRIEQALVRYHRTVAHPLEPERFLPILRLRPTRSKLDSGMYHGLTM